IAVIGLLTESLPGLTTSNTLGPTRIEPVIASTRRELEKLRSEGDIFIVLGHLESKEADLLLRTFSELTAVISGHPHTSQPEPRKVNQGVVVRVRAYGTELGRLDLRWSP